VERDRERDSQIRNERDRNTRRKRDGSNKNTFDTFSETETKQVVTQIRSTNIIIGPHSSSKPFHSISFLSHIFPAHASYPISL